MCSHQYQQNMIERKNTTAYTSGLAYIGLGQKQECVRIKPVNKIIAEFHMLSSIVFIQYTLCWGRFLVVKPTELIRVVDKGALTMDHSGSHVWRASRSLHAIRSLVDFEKE